MKNNGNFNYRVSIVLWKPLDKEILQSQFLTSAKISLFYKLNMQRPIKTNERHQ